MTLLWETTPTSGWVYHRFVHQSYLSLEYNYLPGVRRVPTGSEVFPHTPYVVEDDRSRSRTHRP